MDTPECSICENAFDSNDQDRRPRVLPCGHGFCSKCIETAICQGDKTCAVCRKEHGASTCNDLPFCFILEDFAHKLAVSASQKQVSESDHESNYGFCPKHKEIPLYFTCKTHSIKVCHSCAVIDHPPMLCHLISFEDELKERKNTQIEAYKNQSKSLLNTEKELDKLYKNNCKEIVMMSEKIQQMRLENDNIQDSIEKCKENRNIFMEMENNLCAAMSNKDIAIQCEMGKNEVLLTQEWEENLKKEHNIEQLCAQVERDGILRNSRAFEESGKIFIPCLSKRVKAPSSARLIKEEKLGLNCSTITAFLDISEHGQSHGQMIIRVFQNTREGVHFIKQVLGIDGFSIKGTKFNKDNAHYIKIENSTTEDGLKHLVESSIGTVSGHRVPPKGKLFPNGNSIAIYLHTLGKGRYISPIGNVLSGLDLITTLHASSKFGETEITITDCGIVLNS